MSAFDKISRMFIIILLSGLLISIIRNGQVGRYQLRSDDTSATVFDTATAQVMALKNGSIVSADFRSGKIDEYYRVSSRKTLAIENTIALQDCKEKITKFSSDQAQNAEHPTGDPADKFISQYKTKQTKEEAEDCLKKFPELKIPEK